MPDVPEDAAQFLVLTSQVVTGTIPVGGKEVGVVALECLIGNLQVPEDENARIYLVFDQAEIRPLIKQFKTAAEKVMPLEWQLPDQPEENHTA